MNINDFMKDNYKKLSEASENISDGSHLASELLHYSIEALLEKENLQEILNSGGAYFYIIRIMINSWKSTSSPFYKTYRNLCQDTDFLYLIEEEPIDEEKQINLYKKINEELEALNWYERELFLLYVNGNHTISSLSKETKIPRTSVSVTINNVRRHIKNKIKYENI